MKRPILFSMFCIGFAALSAQIILMRELLIVFYGNEISIGIVLASWLLAGALGSWCAARGLKLLKNPERVFIAGQIVAALLLPLSVLGIRSLRDRFGAVAGEMLGAGSMVAGSLYSVGPLCFVLGAMFVLANHIFRQQGDVSACLGKVYIAEALGSLVGGIVTSYILVSFTGPLTAFAYVMILCSISIFVRARRITVPWKRIVTLSVITVALGCQIFLLLNGWWGSLNELSLQRQWRGYTVIDTRTSRYGALVLAEREGQRSLFVNGLHVATYPDRMAAEETAHLALLMHPAPKKVLLIGGGLGGVLEEALKHPVGRIDYIELDPEEIAFGIQAFDDEEGNIFHDPRAHYIAMDGRRYLLESKEKYDVCIINLGEPYTAQINRFYTVDFFRLLNAHLTDNGIVSFPMSSSENYMNDELVRFFRSLYDSLGAVFPEVKIFPGATAHFFATRLPGMLYVDDRTLMARAQYRNIHPQYMNAPYLTARMSPDRMEQMRGALAGSEGTVHMNHDLRPISYYYGMLIWAGHFKRSFTQQVLRAATPGRLGIVVAVLCLSIIIAGWGLRRKPGVFRYGSTLAISVTGVSGIFFEIIILLAFQSIYGYIFYKMGVLFTAYMAGLVIGAGFAVRFVSRINNAARVVMLTQLSNACYALFLLGGIMLSHRAGYPIVLFLGEHGIFPSLSLMAGGVTGLQFPFAHKLFIAHSTDVSRAAGCLYGCDLIGAAAGAFAASIFFIPLLGIIGSCISLCALNCAAVIFLILLKKNNLQKI